MSGPLLDRINLLVEVPAINAKKLLMQPDGEPSTAVAERVLAARARQQARQGVANAALDATALSNAGWPSTLPPRPSCRPRPTGWADRVARCTGC